jgi:predicted MFS family arabinose efflux permease
MGRAALRENAILAALSGPSSMMNLALPLYLNHLGYPVALVGVMLALGSIASLLSRFAVPRMYRPERSKLLLFATLGGSILTFIPLPFVANMVIFAAVLILNRVFMGIATTIFLARYLDMLAVGADRRQAMGWYGGTQAAGYTSSNVFVGLLADYFGYVAAFMYGVVFCALSMLVLLWAPELEPKPRPARTAAAVRGVRGWLHAVADPGLWGVLNVGFWNNLYHLVMVSFFPILGVAMGLGAAQVGLARGLYSGVNAVGRPMIVVFTKQLSLRQLTYAGLAIQAVLLAFLPLTQAFLAILALFVVFASCRAIVVVANSSGLAEEVDESKVSRGVATSAFSATSDVSNIVAPLTAGIVASFIGVNTMFPLVAGAAFACFVAADFFLQRWRRRVVTAAATLA